MAGYIVVMKFTARHWLALAPSNLQSSLHNYDRPIEDGRPLYFRPVVSSFFFFPRLFLDVADWMSTILHTWSYLECWSEVCCMRLAENTGHKKDRQKFAICAPSHKFVRLYLRN